MRDFNKIDSNEIRLGMRFSAPVFFDDGENMFLAEERAVKQYHIVALARWNIKELLTFGHIITDDDFEDIENLDEIEAPQEEEDVEEVEEIPEFTEKNNEELKSVACV